MSHWQGAPYNPAPSQSQWRPPAAGSGAPAYGGPYNPAQHQASPQGGYYQPPGAPGGYSGGPPPSYQTQGAPTGYYQGPPPTQSMGGGYSQAPPYQSQPPPGQAPYQTQPPPSQAPHQTQPPPSQAPYQTQPPPSQAHFPGQSPPVNQELWTWFQAVDADQSGKITALELRAALLNNNWSQFNPETCRLLIGMFDTNKDGTINFEEFAALWKYVQEWKGCFDRFDQNKSGNIDAGELKQALDTFGYRLSIDFCRLCTRVFDRSDRSTMKFDDFIQCCVMLRSLTESFKKLDVNMAGVISINYEQFLEMAIDNTIQ